VKKFLGIEAQADAFPDSGNNSAEFSFGELTNTLQEKSLAFAGYLKKNIFKQYQEAKELIQKQLEGNGNLYSVGNGNS
jgi:hypothetical protein